MKERPFSLKQRWLRWTVIVPNAMRRMPLIPRNRLFNIYLHHWTGNDDETFGLHDHPWWSLSVTLRGTIQELVHHHAEYDNRWMGRDESEELARMLSGEPIEKRHNLGQWHWKVETQAVPRFKVRGPHYTHAVVTDTKDAWTLFVTGPVVRPWGFYTPLEWVRSKVVCDAVEHWASLGFKFATLLLNHPRMRNKRERTEAERGDG